MFRCDCGRIVGPKITQEKRVTERYSDGNIKKEIVTGPCCDGRPEQGGFLGRRVVKEEETTLVRSA